MKKGTSRAGILVVDDHELVRRGLMQAIDAEADLSVSAQAANTSEALAAVELEMPSLAIVDLTLGGEDGLELVKAMKTRWPALPVLVVSVRDETLYAERALRAHAAGYVMKSAPTREIIAAIRSALAGEVFLSPGMKARLLSGFLRGQSLDDKDPLGGLTDRELHIFQMIGSGMSCRDIAERLGISPRTAETHRENIKNKMAMPSALALTRHAVAWVREAGG